MFHEVRELCDGNHDTTIAGGYRYRAWAAGYRFFALGVERGPVTSFYANFFFSLYICTHYHALCFRLLRRRLFLQRASHVSSLSRARVRKLHKYVSKLRPSMMIVAVRAGAEIPCVVDCCSY